MRVLAYDPFLTEARAKALGVELVTELDAVYRDADFITVHMPVTEQTKGMLNAAAFAKMKPKVGIVNCARGEIIVENDLLAALDSGKVAAAGLDVFIEETTRGRSSVPASTPASRSRRISARSTAEAQEKCGIEVAEVVAGYCHHWRKSATPSTSLISTPRPTNKSNRTSSSAKSSAN